jgi:hypothetical protein
MYRQLFQNMPVGIHTLQCWTVYFFISVNAGMQTELSYFCLLAAMCRITQIWTLAIIYNKYDFVWCSSNSNNRALPSAYKHNRHHMRYFCGHQIWFWTMTAENPKTICCFRVWGTFWGKFHSNHTHNHTASTQCIPASSCQSACTQLVPLKMIIVFRVGKIPRHSSHQTDSQHCPLAFK